MIVGDSLKQVVSQIAEFNGYTPPVPDWVNEGAILGLQGGTDAVRLKYNELKKAQAAIRGVWIQDWVSKRMSLGYSRLWWNWELDTDHYPYWGGLRETLAENNVSILIYMNPMLTNVSEKANAKQNFYAEGCSKNHFIRLNNGDRFETRAFSDFSAAMVDFDKPEAIEFYKRILRNAIETTGAKGMMIDFGEAYPLNNIHLNLERAMKHHN